MLELHDLQSQLAKELELTHLQSDEQEEVINAVGSMLYQRVLAKVFSLVPEDQHGKLTQLIAANLEDEITALLAKHIEDIDNVVHTELTSALAEYKDALSHA